MGIFCFNNRTRKSQAQAFIQLCCKRSNMAPNHNRILLGTDPAPSKQAQPCSEWHGAGVDTEELCEALRDAVGLHIEKWCCFCWEEVQVTWWPLTAGVLR